MPWHLAYIRKSLLGYISGISKKQDHHTSLYSEPPLVQPTAQPLTPKSTKQNNPKRKELPRAPRNYPGLHEISTFNSQAAATIAAWPKVLRSPGAAGQATARKSGIRCASEKHTKLATIAGLIISIRFSCILYYNYTKEHPQTT